MITPVEKRQHLFRRHADQRRQRCAGGARARQSVGTGSGVGVAGVHDDRADGLRAVEVFAADLHRRGAEAVAGEHPRHRAAGQSERPPASHGGSPCAHRPSLCRVARRAPRAGPSGSGRRGEQAWWLSGAILVQRILGGSSRVIGSPAGSAATGSRTIPSPRRTHHEIHDHGPMRLNSQITWFRQLPLRWAAGLMAMVIGCP